MLTHSNYQLMLEVQLPDDIAAREYQKEPAAPGIQGRNCIIVAPVVQERLWWLI